MTTLRFRFAKYGAMRYLGHLDLLRYFQKAVRRADIPVAYSGGFSPHQIMSFAAPLGMGLEGLDAVVLEDALRFRAEKHRVAVKGDADLADMLIAASLVGTGQEHTGGDARVDSVLHVRLIGRKEKVRAESLQVGGDGRAAGEGCAADVQAVMGDGPEDAQAGVWAVSRHDDHFH